MFNSALFSAKQVGSALAANRIVIAPMTRSRSASGDVPTDCMYRNDKSGICLRKCCKCYTPESLFFKAEIFLIKAKVCRREPPA